MLPQYYTKALTKELTEHKSESLLGVARCTQSSPQIRSQGKNSKGVSTEQWATDVLDKRSSSTMVWSKY